MLDSGAGARESACTTRLVNPAGVTKPRHTFISLTRFRHTEVTQVEIVLPRKFAELPVATEKHRRWQGRHAGKLHHRFSFVERDINDLASKACLGSAD